MSHSRIPSRPPAALPSAPTPDMSAPPRSENRQIGSSRDSGSRGVLIAFAVASILALPPFATGCKEAEKPGTQDDKVKDAAAANATPNPPPAKEQAAAAPARSTAEARQPASPTPPPAVSGTATAGATPPAAEPVPVPPGWKKYVNTKEALPNELKDKFVEFTFNYPEKFAIVPGSTNFIKVEESISGSGGSFTLENFAVGNMVASPEMTPGMDQEMIFPMLLEQFGTKFAQGFPNYKKVGEAPEEVGGLRGRALLFQAEFKGTEKGDIAFYGKALLLRRKGKERGVALMMLATSLDPDVKSAADVGVKGDLGAILKTFRLTGD